MIYTIIACEEKRDGRVFDGKIYTVENPMSLLPENIFDYINNTKNWKTRQERFLAYTSLFCSLKVFYGTNNFSIEKTDKGKPYLKTKNTHQKNEDHKIFISISHSDGISAVTLSDEGEVGVDIQSEIDEDKAARLSSRFMSEVTVKQTALHVDYYFCYVSEEKAILEKKELFPIKNKKENFSEKWSYSESLMKLCGGGFSDLKKLKNICENIETEMTKIDLEKNYYLATSIRKK